MADEWIKFRKSLIKDGRVRILSRSCHAHSVTVIGALVTLWCLADEHADDDGVIFGYTAEDINNEVGLDNFCEALPAEWMDLSGEWVKLPDYQEHNGATAKKRAQNAKRQSRTRSRSSHANSNASSVTDSNAPSVTGALPRREEKRRDNSKGKFQKPLLEDIQEYCKERGNNVNPLKFFNHYESNGWKVGKNSMKDWKAAVRTWEQNSFDSKPQQPDAFEDVI